MIVEIEGLAVCGGQLELFEGDVTRLQVGDVGVGRVEGENEVRMLEMGGVG